MFPHLSFFPREEKESTIALSRVAETTRKKIKKKNTRGGLSSRFLSFFYSHESVVLLSLSLSLSLSAPERREEEKNVFLLARLFSFVLVLFEKTLSSAAVRRAHTHESHQKVVKKILRLMTFACQSVTLPLSVCLNMKMKDIFSRITNITKRSTSIMNAARTPTTTTTIQATSSSNAAALAAGVGAGAAPKKPRHQRVEILCRSKSFSRNFDDADDVDECFVVNAEKSFDSSSSTQTTTTIQKTTTRRKAMMVSTTTTAFAFASMVLSIDDDNNKNGSYYAFAAEEDESSTKMMNTNTNKNTTTYTDEVLKFSLSYPTDSWQLLVGETGGSGDRSGSRQVIAFAPKNANPKDVNISLVATPVGADYPKMGSFGSPFEFGYNMVNPMNKPKAKKGREDEVQYSELIEAGSKGLNYFVEYELTRPSTGIDSKQLVVAGIGYDGRVSHLYSTTAQMPKGEEEKWRPEIEKILESLVLPPPLYN